MIISPNIEPTLCLESGNTRTPEILLDVNTTNSNVNDNDESKKRDNAKIDFKSIIKDAQEINNNLMTSILTGSKS